MKNQEVSGPRNQGSNSDTSIVPHFMLLSSLIFEDERSKMFLNLQCHFQKASTKISEHDVGKNMLKNKLRYCHPPSNSYIFIQKNDQKIKQYIILCTLCNQYQMLFNLLLQKTNFWMCLAQSTQYYIKIGEMK